MIVLKLVLRIVASITSYTLFLLTLLSGFGGHVSPHIITIPSMLALIFPYLFTATIIVGVVWLIAGHYLHAIVAAGVVVITWTASMDAVPLSFSKSAKQQEKSFTLLSWNVMEFIDNTTDTKPQKVNAPSPSLSYLIGSDADVICLEETSTLTRKDNEKLKKASRQQMDTLRQIYPYVIPAKRTDITLLSKYPARLVRSGSTEGSYYALFTLDIYNHRVNVLGVHLTSYALNNADMEVVSDIHGLRSAKRSMNLFKTAIRHKLSAAFVQRASAAKYVREMLDSITGDVIVCGDFNDVPCSWAYRKVKGADLHDAYAKTGFGPMVTYNDHFFWFHIDQILYRGALRALRVDKGKLRTSDHYPLTATFAITPPEN